MRFKRWFGRPDGPMDVRIDGRDGSIAVKPGQTLLQAALEAGVDFPHLCRVGSCGTCRCRLLSGRVRMLTDASYVLSADELRDGYILACQAIVRSPARVALDVNAPTPASAGGQRVHGTIRALVQLAPRVFELRIALEQALRYVPGQYADIHHPAVNGGRAYSFVVPQAPAHDREVAFHVSPVAGGRFSTWLFARDRCGEEVALAGPYGTFGWPSAAAAAVLCVAGGSGMGVIQAILRGASIRGTRAHVVFFYGARTQRDLYGLDAVAAIQAQWHGAFVFVPVLSEEPATSAWAGVRGRVADCLHAGGMVPPPATSRALLCGPPRMVDAALARLRALGWSAPQIAFDKFERHDSPSRAGSRELSVEEQ